MKIANITRADGVKAVRVLDANGNVLWSKSILPSGYIECEYLESNGNQWIDTGIKLVEGDTCECVFETGTNQLRGLFGSRQTSDYANVWISNTAGKLRVDYAPKDYSTVVNYIQNVFQNLIVRRGYVKVENDEYFYPSAPAFIAQTNNCYLFTFNDNGIPRSGGLIGKVKHFGISGSQSLQFIPCLDPNGRPCMYDTISKQPFYNQGTGEFTYKIK